MYFKQIPLVNWSWPGRNRYGKNEYLQSFFLQIMLHLCEIIFFNIKQPLWVIYLIDCKKHLLRSRGLMLAWLTTAWKIPKAKICSIRVPSLIVWRRQNHSDLPVMPYYYTEYEVKTYSLPICAQFEWLWLPLQVDTEILRRLLVDSRLKEE